MFGQSVHLWRFTYWDAKWVCGLRSRSHSNDAELTAALACNLSATLWETWAKITQLIYSQISTHDPELVNADCIRCKVLGSTVTHQKRTNTILSYSGARLCHLSEPQFSHPKVEKLNWNMNSKWVSFCYRYVNLCAERIQTVFEIRATKGGSELEQGAGWQWLTLEQKIFYIHGGQAILSFLLPQRNC